MAIFRWLEHPRRKRQPPLDPRFLPRRWSPSHLNRSHRWKFPCGLVFAETSTVPDFDCTIDVLFAGQTHAVLAKDGIWSMAIDAPASSGSLPMTWEVGCLEGQGVDMTDQSASVKWIVVDGTGPEPQEVLSPRPHGLSLVVKTTKFEWSCKNWVALTSSPSSWSGRSKISKRAMSFVQAANPSSSKAKSY